MDGARPLAVPTMSGTWNPTSRELLGSEASALAELGDELAALMGRLPEGPARRSFGEAKDGFAAANALVLAELAREADKDAPVPSTAD